MPSPAILVIADNVPANHNFYPIKSSMARSVLENREALTYAGRMSLGLTMSQPTANRSTVRQGFDFTFPNEVLLDGVTSVRDVARANVQVVLPAAMTDAEKLKFYTMWKNYICSSIVQGYVTNGDPYY